ncbi:hypothetical protein [Prochlorococcus sp. MIT 1341]|nr:hypothetical protein [Prochlorococcus sp. MIT 1341]
MSFLSTFALDLISGQAYEAKNIEVNALNEEDIVEAEEQAIYGYTK